MSELWGDWVTNPPAHLLLLVPALAFLEACAGVGLFVSGVFLLSTSTLLYAQETTSLGFIIVLAFLGALAGDHTGYLLGNKLGPRLWRHSWLAKRQARIDKIHRLLEKSAPWAICIGRLSPPIRSVTPIVAGVSGMKPLAFLAYDLLACTIWAVGLSLLVTIISSQM